MMCVPEFGGEPVGVSGWGGFVGEGIADIGFVVVGCCAVEVGVV